MTSRCTGIIGEVCQAQTKWPGRPPFAPRFRDNEPMTDQRSSDLQRQIDELVAAVAMSRANIAGLTQRAEASQQRADESERRADEAEARSAVDREMIAELQADGVLSREHAADLEAALVTSRSIGSALGILMASRNIGQEEALLILKGASQRTNTKMRVLAETIVAGADAIK